MRFFFLLLLGGSLVMPAHAADAQSWLSRLLKAERQQSFQGVFVYERNGSFSTHAIWHLISQKGGARERLLKLDGSPAEMLRVDGRLRCVSSASADQLIEEGAWPPRPLDPQELTNWYELRMVGESRVAGRTAVVLAILPRDQYRYGFELHLDRETALPLKSLLLNEKGQLLERFQFTQLDTSTTLAKEKLEPGPACRPVQVLDAEGAEQDSWRSEWLPPGFTLRSVHAQPSPISGETVTYLMYGDGLARFSVFIEPLRGVPVEDARSQVGPTVAVSKRMATADGDVMITVIGEIPLGTAERIALSMRAGGKKAD
ncbi:MucB/RseB C-terminal domain-containing protein [Azotobacter beijerinckii]|uniref:MucB/RseB C-terminal domain-containing protein n=1 Tax=Azotobacter beijerinckii TaxID=170623 RepID=UPI002953444A|nr:MucB/RseB C-terminal domain-containing protein [Azotobacter beijerinckii]MDV7212260.1 MucB/RseB C-terminal domain-containing protein [Azotobacter beijerinckii]